jgi:D-methionine transport system substrate-binding protein
LLLEKIPPHYLNLVAVRSGDLDKPYVQDIANAYKSPELRRVVDERFKGFTRPDYLR